MKPPNFFQEWNLEPITMSSVMRLALSKQWTHLSSKNSATASLCKCFSFNKFQVSFWCNRNDRAHCSVSQRSFFSESVLPQSMQQSFIIWAASVPSVPSIPPVVRKARVHKLTQVRHNGCNDAFSYISLATVAASWYVEKFLQLHRIVGTTKASQPRVFILLVQM